MSQNFKLVKLVTGEVVAGMLDEKAGVLKDVAILQISAKDQKMQLLLFPYGYPFQQTFTVAVEAKHFMFVFDAVPDHLEDRYNAACAHTKQNQAAPKQ